jgi:uncharacterized membrane protein YfcA
MSMILSSLLMGSLVGLSLGLTGGGGAVLAVPMLVFGFQLPPDQAVLISLIAVGTTSIVGFLNRFRVGQVEVPTGLLFATAGALGAPLGNWVSRQLPPLVLMIGFALLTLVVAVRMLRQSMRQGGIPEVDFQTHSTDDGPACQRDSQGRLLLHTRCALLMILVGVLTGFLSGLFGVGGGFVIVPALILFSNMALPKAVGTSLLVISLVSLSGFVSSQILTDQTIPWEIAIPFSGAGVLGLLLGQSIAHQLPTPVLQRLFAILMMAMALWIIASHWFPSSPSPGEVTRNSFPSELVASAPKPRSTESAPRWPATHPDRDRIPANASLAGWLPAWCTSPVARAQSLPNGSC